jgi:hypothetical protein
MREILAWNITLPIRYEWIEDSTACYETNMSGLGGKGFRLKSEL